MNHPRSGTLHADSRPWTTNLIIAAMGLAIFAAVNLRSGRIEANDGLGWDGRQYAHMVTGGLVDGTEATQTRPLLPLLTRLPHAAGLDILSSFRLMNFIYAAVLYVALCLLFDRYRVETRYKAYFVVTVAMCIATSVVFAFYPTLVDLGALAVVTASTGIVLTRSGWRAGAAALVAVTARELGGAVAFLGIVREWRQGRGLARAALTYAPAIATMVLLRLWASATNVGDRRPLAASSDFIANLALWRDPAFVGFFLYFALTLLGGVTLLLAIRPASLARLFIGKPELATYAVLIAAAAVVGNADIWRYLVFLLPVLAVLFASYVREHRPGPWLLGGALVLTVVTQVPFVPMDMTRYFQEWFPGYVYMTDDATDAFWSGWRFRAVLTSAGLAGLVLVQWMEQRWRRPPVSNILAAN